MPETKTMVYDAKGKVLGRLASVVAKNLLNGNGAVVINSEQAVITGSKKVILARYKTRVNLKEKANPEHSAYWSRRAGPPCKENNKGHAASYRMPRGKDAYRRLRVYIGVPEDSRR